MPRPLCYPVRTAGGEYVSQGLVPSFDVRGCILWALDFAQQADERAELAMTFAPRLATNGDYLVLLETTVQADQAASQARGWSEFAGLEWLRTERLARTVHSRSGSAGAGRTRTR